MIYDYCRPLIPMPDDFWPHPPQHPFTPGPMIEPKTNELERLQKLIEDFHRARDAAKIIDALTNKPDCADPEKAKLEEHVAALEKQIAKLRGLKPHKTRKKKKT